MPQYLVAATEITVAIYRISAETAEAAKAVAVDRAESGNDRGLVSMSNNLSASAALALSKNGVIYDDE